jgi:hypothetical protein
MNLGIYGDHERVKYRKDLLTGNQEIHINEMVQHESSDQTAIESFKWLFNQPCTNIE